MTVRINKPALNVREELTKAQSVVRYEQRQFWMDGLVENGTFDTADGWGGYWTISGGVATNNSGVNTELSYSMVGLKTGRKYKVTFDKVTSTGGVKVDVASPFIDEDNTYIYAQGTHEQIVTGGSSNTNLVFWGSDGASIDNVTVFEVDENDEVIHSLPLGFKPVHVYEDGLLQREGDNYDYTVVDTGFEYQIKPTVAPSATTETCVIAEREL